MTQMKVKRLAFGLGAEISGVDLTRPVQPDVAAQLLGAWQEHSVLVFREQALTHAQHIEFARNFGEIELVPVKHLRGSDYPEIMTISNRVKDGQRSKTENVGRQWHTDGAYNLRPAAGSLLRCQEMPEYGGNTWFTSMYMAYDTLSDTMKRLLDGLQAVNLFPPRVLKTALKSKEENVEDFRDREHPPVLQPVVRTHPKTGRKALYVSETYSKSIDGMTQEESNAILQFLFKHCVRPEFTYRHYWRKHDLVMWDNSSTMHLAPGDYDSSQLREMHRVTLIGTPSGSPHAD